MEGNYFNNKISVIIATALRKFDPSAVVVKAVNGSVFCRFTVELNLPHQTSSLPSWKVKHRSCAAGLVNCT